MGFKVRRGVGFSGGGGRLFVLSAPSGSGKTTVLARLLRSEKNAVRSISATTRPPRGRERDGRDYWFWSRQRFARERRRGGLLEWARVLDHWYGTPRGPVERALKAGKDVFLGIDVQGAAKLRRSGLPVTTLFLLPPSMEVLKRRLVGRGTETARQVRQRLALARRELKELGKFDYAVVNATLVRAVADVRAIRRAERCRVRRGERAKESHT